jgi:hypothetical protein
MRWCTHIELPALVTGVRPTGGNVRERTAMSGSGGAEDQIRERAYALWELDGRPEGRSEDYWQQARQEFEAGSREAEPEPPVMTPAVPK